MINTKPRVILTLNLVAILIIGGISCRVESTTPTFPPVVTASTRISLSPPTQQGSMSVEQAMALRRSVRAFADRRLTQADLSQLLWAAQGITDARGFRTAPSAGALYPLELYVVSLDGFYHYRPDGHALELLTKDDLRQAVWEHGLKQDALRDAPAVFVIAAVFQRTANKYGGRAERYVYMEAGHAAQNLLLQAVALGLGAVPIGAFYDDDLKAALALPADHEPVYMIAVGYPGE